MKRNYFIICLTLFIWGSLYVVSKYAFETIPPISALFIRNIVGLVPLGFLAWKKGWKKIEREHYLFFAFLGFFGYFLGVGCQLIATNMMAASVAALINSINPLFTAFFAVLLLKEEVTVNKIAGILLSIIGVGIVLGVGGCKISAAGVAASVMSVTLWSLSCVEIRKISGIYSSQQIIFTAIACATPFSLIGMLIELQYKTLSFKVTSVAAILYMGLICTGLANFLWARALKKVEASICTMFYPLQPFFATILGIVLLHEKITVNFVIGGILISVGIIFGVKQKTHNI